MAIHRFNFGQQLNNEIQQFANRHRFDNKEDFKENFKIWCELEHIQRLINQENMYLMEHEYMANIDTIKKIYRSIKYYYVKKFSSDDNKERKQKKKINIIDLDMMEQIKADIIHNFNTNPKFKPSDTFKLFTTSEDPIIKKCYKNQYFQIKNKLYKLNDNK